MSLLRRRIMMARKPSEGGIETTLQFPLYIYFDYCEEIWNLKNCSVYADFSELARYLTECTLAYGEKIGSEMGGTYCLKGENLSKIGEIYIEDKPIEEVYIYLDYDSYVECSTEDYRCSIEKHYVTGEAEIIRS